MHSSIELERPQALNTKPRKMSTGGNRSWSEEEVCFILFLTMDLAHLLTGSLFDPNQDAKDAL
jgi:hypothetical protein